MQDQKTIVNPDETLEELVNQIANFGNIQRMWHDKITFENAMEPEGETYWKNYVSAIDAQVAYTLALKDRMLRDGVYFVETTTHTASLDGTANDLNTITPVIERKQA